MREKREMKGGDKKGGFSNGKQILAVQFKFLFLILTSKNYDRCHERTEGNEGRG